jgi:hypothetical protein
VFGGAIVGAISALAASGNPAHPPPQLILGLIGGAFGFFSLLLIGGQLLDLAIRAAVLRAELEPGHSAFAYLRFGSQELWLIGASLVFWFVLVAANFAMSIPLGIVSMAGAAGTVLSGGGGTPNVGAIAGMFGIRTVGQLVILAVSTWLWLRLCFGVVMTFRERQFRLFESWAATRGHVLKMFLTLLLVMLMLLVLFTVLATVCFVVAGAALVSAAAGNWQALWQRPPAEIASLLWPVGIAVLVLIAVNVAVGNALIWSAVARMWQQLNPDADAAGAFS